MAQLEIKKMKQGMSYSCKEKTIILNVFKYFRLQFPEKCVTEIVRRTAKATGCSEKSIFQFRKEEASVEGFKEPSKTKIRKNININSRDIKYDNSVRQAIRNIIYDLKYRNIVPSLNTILKQVKADTQMPNFSLMTLRRLLFDMGFCYEKSGNKSILVEKQDGKIAHTDSIPQKIENKKAAVQAQAHISNVVHINGSLPEPPQNPPSHLPHMINEQHPHRFMHMPQPPDSHMMPPMHDPHGMPMMINARRELMPPLHAMPPTNIDVHMKRDIPPWIHPHSHSMVKQQ